MKLPYLPIHILFFLLFLPYASSISFQTPRFDASATNIVYEGDALPAVGVIELINKYRYICRVGRATYAERIPLWNSRTGKVTDFTTHFSFVIQRQESDAYGEGIAFFLAPFGYQIPPNSAGGFLGLLNTTTSYFAGSQIVVVEFDPFVNPEWDPLYRHVGINNNSLYSVAKTPWNVSLHDGDTTDVWITYSATTTTLSVNWSYRTTPASPKETTSLSYQIDLAKVLPEWVTVGFSAGTGEDAGTRYQIESWEFNSTLHREYTGPGHVKRANKTLTITAVLVTISVGSLIAGLVAANIPRLCRRRNKEAEAEEERLTSLTQDSSDRGAGSRRYSYSEIQRATNNFSEEVGEGGSGTVYRGNLNTDLDTAVAVKKISSRSGQGRREYMTEVKLISSLRHPNLVQLKGWGHDKEEKTFLLVYEFMPKGSLDVHLFGKGCALTWDERYKICEGLATALLYLHDPYLHQGWKQCVVHRDIKSSNILLDSRFNVKLGDFGLARLMDFELDPETTEWAGTQGYVDPEYVLSRKASKESDVYSFGVVILEIATGEKSVDHPMRLVKRVWDLYEQEKLLSAVDKRLLQKYNNEQAERLMMVGLLCAHPDRDERPSIRQAIQYLHFDADFPNLPKKMPVRVYQQPTSPSVSSNEALSITSCLLGGR
ncbi:L-type lectin-domain containing receptor kinase IX.1-like [Rosa rugosa]|uniref:L-type lectin-domain containing receptor kinase IX.1-like n=1 Tax=Rosa rugosa TaxID=74645 RepID=UPI002B41000A|nr:L-type lectin-domain containing receptor kinase IX.1-like [Rosa rugosa]